MATKYDLNFKLPRYRMELVSQNDFKNDFVGKPISGPAAYFFVVIPKFNFKPIFNIKISEKNTQH